LKVAQLDIFRGSTTFFGKMTNGVLLDVDSQVKDEFLQGKRVEKTSHACLKVREFIMYPLPIGFIDNAFFFGGGNDVVDTYNLQHCL